MNKEEFDFRRILSMLKLGLTIMVLLAIAYMFLGCSNQPQEPKVIVKVETKEVKVPVPPRIPEIDCDFEGEGLEPTDNLLKCLILHKRILDLLRTNRNAVEDPSLTDSINKIVDETYRGNPVTDIKNSVKK